MFEEFFERGVMNMFIRSTLIIHVPKKTSSMELGDFCPICLVTSLYKIVSKVLSLRLKGVMELMVSSTRVLLFRGDRFWIVSSSLMNVLMVKEGIGSQG